MSSTSDHQDYPAMAKEGEISGIATITRIMYSVLICYSLLASFLGGGRWYTQIIFYFVFLMLFYIWHWLAHQKFMGKMHKIHWEHHFESFPPSRFYGKDGDCERLYGKQIPTLWDLLNPKRSTNFTLHHEGLLYVFLGITMVVARLVFSCSWTTLSFSVAMAATIGMVGSALHSSFHVKGFHLERYSWYRQLRTLHYMHHLGNTQHNFGILNIELVDGIFNTIKVFNPSKKEEDKKAKITLPDKISINDIKAVQSTNGSLTRYMLLSEIQPSPELESQILAKRGFPTAFVRFIIVVIGIWLWRSGLDYLMSVSHPIEIIQNLNIYDVGHELVSPITRVIKDVDHAPEILYNSQIIISDLIGVILICKSLFGRSIRPALTGIIALSIRTSMQFVTPFVTTSSQSFALNITVPTLFSNTDTSASFISPHIIIATILFMECLSNLDGDGNPIYKIFLSISVLCLAYYVGLSLVLRMNWSIDIMIAFAVSFGAMSASNRIAPALDYIRCL